MTGNAFKKVIATCFLCNVLGCGSELMFGGQGGVDIWKAVEEEDLAAIEAYAAAGENLDVGKLRHGKTPLIYAIELQKKQSYETLLSVGASPNTECRGGKTAIHQAAYQHDSFWLEKCLLHGGDANLMNNAKGLSKGTPMYYAIPSDHSHHIENVLLLLDHGADINARIDGDGRHGFTALAKACVMREYEIAYLLLERGADYNEGGLETRTFLFTVKCSRLGDFTNDEYEEKWSKAVWDWLSERGIDPDKAVWGGDKWILEPHRSG